MFISIPRHARKLASLNVALLALVGCSTTQHHSNKVSWVIKEPVFSAEVHAEIDALQYEPKSQSGQYVQLDQEPQPSVQSERPQAFKPASLSDSDAFRARRHTAAAATAPPRPLKRLRRLENEPIELSAAADAPMIFDIPIAYNDRVKRWIEYFQSSGRVSFKRWLERSARYMPIISSELEAARLPQDLAYVAMIESGFQPDAASGARAVGLWQFMAQTGARYGLRVGWWLDERRDFQKSTKAAIGYMTDLYKIFGSWHLVAASYNMGESGVLRLLKRHGTNDFWKLADLGALPEETKNYVPKILAATLIAKAPALYGFRELSFLAPHSFDWFIAPGGTDLGNLAEYLGVSARYMHDLNPELTRGFVPRETVSHRIRVPKGAALAAARFAERVTLAYRSQAAY